MAPSLLADRAATRRRHEDRNHAGTRGVRSPTTQCAVRLPPPKPRTTRAAITTCIEGGEPAADQPGGGSAPREAALRGTHSGATTSRLTVRAAVAPNPVLLGTREVCEDTTRFLSALVLPGRQPPVPRP
jgi:hypothetical protein